MLGNSVGTLLMLLQVFVLASTDGTKGSPGNQWTQNPNQQQFPQTKGAPLGGWDDEVMNPRGGNPDNSNKWKLEDSVPGVPGQSYPNYDKLPQTSFDCRMQTSPGYYADTEAMCQVFHICQADGRQNSFLCPVGTIYNQETFVCDWWFNVNCADTSMYTMRNDNLYKSPYIGIDGMKTSSYYSQNQDQGSEGNQGPGGGLRGGQGGGIEQGRRKMQGRGQTFGGSKAQGGNIQPPAVGIPSSVPQSSGRNWPAQGQGNFPAQGQGNFPSQPGRQNGNMKGNGRNINRQLPNNGNRGVMNMGNIPSNFQPNMNQKGGSTGGTNFQNKSPMNAVNRPRGMHPEMNQKGARRGGSSTNVGRNHQNDFSRGNEKGRNGSQGSVANRNVDWSQKGNTGTANPSRGQGQQGSMKGDPRNQRNPHMQGSNFGGSNNIGMGPNQSKGFNANSWSMRPQNFQADFVQDRTSSGSDIWSNNINSDVGSQEDNYHPYPSRQHGQNFKNKDDNTRWSENSDQNNNWSNNNENVHQWQGNINMGNEFQSNGGPSQGFLQNQKWKSEANMNRETSWQTNEQFRNNHEMDYDYV